jgi:chromosomal replication initiation ATPase DnaA
MILGKTGFIKETLKRLKEENLQKEDISYKKALQTEYTPKEVIDSMCVYFNVSQDKILKNKNKEYRNIAIYLIKKYTGLTNKQLGQLFGNISYSAVAKVCQRFSKKLEKDIVLKKKVGEIKRNMSNVKG